MRQNESWCGVWLLLTNASGRRASSQGEKLLTYKKKAGSSTSGENWQGINLGWIANLSSFRATDPLGSQVKAAPCTDIALASVVVEQPFLGNNPSEDH